MARNNSNWSKNLVFQMGLIISQTPYWENIAEQTRKIYECVCKSPARGTLTVWGEEQDFRFSTYTERKCWGGGEEGVRPLRSERGGLCLRKSRYQWPTLGSTTSYPPPLAYKTSPLDLAIPSLASRPRVANYTANFNNHPAGPLFLT